MLFSFCWVLSAEAEVPEKKPWKSFDLIYFDFVHQMLFPDNKLGFREKEVLPGGILMEISYLLTLYMCIQ